MGGGGGGRLWGPSCSLNLVVPLQTFQMTQLGTPTPTPEFFPRVGRPRPSAPKSLRESSRAPPAQKSGSTNPLSSSRAFPRVCLHTRAFACLSSRLHRFTCIGTATPPPPPVGRSWARSDGLAVPLSLPNVGARVGGGLRRVGGKSGLGPGVGLTSE